MSNRMEKMAIFVEGQTEQEFAQALVRAIAGAHLVQVDMMKGHGGGRTLPRQFLELHAIGPDSTKEFYVIIYDSSNDSRVLSDIRDQYESLMARGFRWIIGIRDVYPQALTDIPAIWTSFDTFSPTGPVMPVL